MLLSDSLQSIGINLSKDILSHKLLIEQVSTVNSNIHMNNKMIFSGKYKALSRSCSTLILIAIFIPITLVHCSPPLEYFLYTASTTSQQHSSSSLSSSSVRELPSIESIYSVTTPTTNDDPQQDEKRVYFQQLANRTLAIVRNSTHSHDNNIIDINVARYAWHLMEKQSLMYYKNTVETYRPIVSELLKEAQVSTDCMNSIDSWLDELKLLKHWASLMWNSWGQFPPAGLFEGSFTDLGSYRGCMSIKDNEIIGESQYCTLDYQPLVPTRPRFHSIYKKVLDVDTFTRHLVNGDFRSLDEGDQFESQRLANSLDRLGSLDLNPEPKEIKNKKITSSTSAHSFSSQMFKKFNSKRTIEYSPNGSTSLDINQLLYTNNNLTITAEALVELAQKAQYFYYVKFRLGACMPSKCTPLEVERIAKRAGERAILQVSKVKCLKKAPSSLNAYQKFAIWILSSLAFVALAGTAIDLMGYKETRDSSSIIYWLLPFSIWTNGKRLFDSETAGAHTDLECIHGLRFFSMLWVVYGHTILYTEYQAFTHFFDVVETQIPSLILLPTFNANFSVDTFFVISGILTTYVTWEYTKGDYRKFNKFAFAISRYVRLTPQLAIVMLCFFLLPLFGDGPIYKQVTEEQAGLCYKNWLVNLLYLQTYVNSEKLCIDPSWWLSIEMTFHLISMLVIIIMIKNVRQGMIANFILAAFLTIWGAIIHYKNGFAIQYLPSIPQRYEVQAEQTQIFFHRPYPHAASYFIGIALGYVLAERTVKKLPKPMLYQGWFVCTIGIVVSLWGSYYWNLGAPYSQLEATVYYNLCQILWPVSIAWIILACSVGHGGLVNSILSAKCFVPLGRITYMTYLSHALIIYYHSASINIPIEPSRLLFIYLFLANTALSLLLGIILTVVYESPLLNLQKILFNYLTMKFDPTIREARPIPNSPDVANNTPTPFVGTQTIDPIANKIDMPLIQKANGNCGTSSITNGFQQSKTWRP